MSTPRTPGPGRQAIRSNATRTKLVRVGRTRFAARGFDAVPAEEIAERITRAAGAHDGVWEGLVAGCLAFLDACTDPEVQRIVLLDGPAVLGWERWREVDAAHGLGLLKEGLREVMAAGELAEQPVDPLAHLLSGAMNEAGMWIARAATPKRARRDAGAALRAMLESLRTSR